MQNLLTLLEEYGIYVLLFLSGYLYALVSLGPIRAITLTCSLHSVMVTRIVFIAHKDSTTHSLTSLFYTLLNEQLMSIRYRRDINLDHILLVLHDTHLSEACEAEIVSYIKDVVLVLNSLNKFRFLYIRRIGKILEKIEREY